MDVAVAIAGLGFGANITALAWIMKTLYAMRQEISGAHATFKADIADHERRIIRLEGTTA